MYRLVTFGCSFTQGVIRTPEFNGLVDTTWGQRIANNLGWGFLNLSRTASGNVEIAKQIWDHDIQPDDILVICWSGLARPFHWDTRTKSFRSPHNDYTESFFPEGAIGFEAFLFFSETMIRATAQKLQEQGVKFLMTAAFHSIGRYPFTDTIQTEKINWIEPEYESNTLWDIIQENWLKESEAISLSELNAEDKAKLNTKYMASCGHPSQLGHMLIGDTLTPYVKNLV